MGMVRESGIKCDNKSKHIHPFSFPYFSVFAVAFAIVLALDVCVCVCVAIVCINIITIKGYTDASIHTCHGSVVETAFG